MKFGFWFQLLAAILALNGCIAATTTNQKFQKSTVDTALWTPNPTLVKTGTLTVCSIQCVLKTTSTCNGFTYNDSTKQCTLGLFNPTGTPGNTATVDIYKAV